MKGRNKELECIEKKLDMVVVILLAQSGLNKKEVSKIFRVSEKTIERMLPFGKLKQKK